MATFSDGQVSPVELANCDNSMLTESVISRDRIFYFRGCGLGSLGS